MPYKLNVGKVRAFEKVRENSSSLTLIKMLGSNVTITEEIVQMAKKCLNFNAQLIINKYNLSARLSLYENLIMKSSVPFPPYPESSFNN